MRHFPIASATVLCFGLLAACGCAHAHRQPKTPPQAAPIPEAQWKEAKVTRDQAIAIALASLNTSPDTPWKFEDAITLINDPAAHHRYWAVTLVLPQQLKPGEALPLYVPGASSRTIDVDADTGEVLPDHHGYRQPL